MLQSFLLENQVNEKRILCLEIISASVFFPTQENNLK
jgi:hypothetical protein